MIEKLRHDYQFDESTFSVECDDCGENEEVEGTFQDCLDFMKNNGWRTKKDGNDWLNYCPECGEKVKA